MKGMVWETSVLDAEEVRTWIKLLVMPWMWYGPYKAFFGLRAVELISEIELIQRLQTSNYFALAEIC